MKPTVLWLEETPSTNSYLKEHTEVTDYCLTAARSQTAGRGQRGNSWEAEPGKNVTASMQFRPEGIAPALQFAVSEAVALAVTDTLASFGITAKIKWPNDIYVADSKICGILIENSLMGQEIVRSIAGIGLNVNQTEFLSDAPNPVSMRKITGREYSIEEVAEKLAEKLYARLEGLSARREAVHEEFQKSLWRGDGKKYPYRDVESGEEFLASIEKIEPSGHLVLREPEGSLRRYSFKEVIFLI